MIAARVCWITIEKIIGRAASSGKKPIAKTNAAFVFLKATAKVIETSSFFCSLITLDTICPVIKPNIDSIKAATMYSKKCW